MEDEKIIIKSKKMKTFFVVFSLLLVFGFGIISFIPISKTKVNANSTEFIQNNPYTIAITNILTAVDSPSNDPEFPINIANGIGSHFLSFDYVGSLGNISIIPTYNYKKLVNDSYGTENFVFDRVYFTSSHNSQRYRFTSSNIIYIPFYDLIPNSDENDVYTGFDVFTYRCTNIEININKSNMSTGFKDWFDNIFVCRLLLYRSGNNDIKLNCVYGYSTDTLNSNPYMSIYYTFPLEEVHSINSGYSYDLDVLKIDRSDYIKEVVTEINPLDNLFATIPKGVSTFFELEIFPNFTLGSIFAICLGVSCIAMLLHIIVK